MCGICGFTGSGSRDSLYSMGDAIEHRGPDESGYYQDDLIALCSRRLSIVDIEQGHQPVTSDDGSLVCIINGEIYNHNELREELYKKGCSFRSSHSDSEVFGNVLRMYGTDGLYRLNGMFAAAVWNKNTSSLTLVRDRLGVKPLFYYYDGQNIIFASEIKSILANSKYVQKVNKKALYNYFSFGNVVAPATAFEGIYSLMPGTVLKYEGGQIAVHRYWKADYSVSSADNKNEASIRVDELLSDAVDIRMKADTDVGIFLSGGLDSALITAMASRKCSKIKTFSLGHESKEHEFYNKSADVDMAARLARELGTEHYEYILTPDMVVRDADKIIRSFDQPFAGALSTYYVAKLAAGHVKTVLSGDGADELFGSYVPHILAYPLQEYKLWKKKGKFGAIVSKYSKLLTQLHDYAGKDEILSYYRMLIATDEEKALYLNSDFGANLSDDRETLMELRRCVTGSTAFDPLNRILEYYVNTLMPDQVLAYSDALSMAHSLEVRSPYLDYRLVEYMASIPGNIKIQNRTKEVLKITAASYLPEDMINRPKEGLVMPVYDWMKDELREFITDTLAMDSVEKYGFIDGPAVYFLLKKYYSDPENNSGLSRILWSLTMFQIWCTDYL